MSTDDIQREHDFAEEIARQVETRLIAKAASFLLLNAAALIASIATGIGAYYALDKRISNAEARITINDARIERLINEDIALRQAIREGQADVSTHMNDIRRLFYEHDSSLRRRDNNR